jgi:LuxR family maltose regulon positive regulatory protein
MHLTAELPDQVAVLNMRASEWYEQNGLIADAIRHTLIAKDFERAAELIERALPITRQNRQEAMLLEWLRALPDEVLQNRPVLSVHYAGTLLQNGLLEGVESRLRDAERWLDTPSDAREQPIFVEEEEFRRLPAAIAMYHAALALAYGDVAGTMRFASNVLDLLREDDNFMRGAAASLLGLASWTSGDLEAGYQMFSQGMEHLHRVGFISDVIGGAVTLADIRITQGRLREATSIYERGLQLATVQNAPPVRGAADMHVGLSKIYRERNDLRAAEQHLLKSKELGELNGLPKNPFRWRVAMARLQEAHGELNDALALLDEAAPLYVGDFSPNVRPVAAWKARVYVKLGDLERALDWAQQQKLSVEEEPGFLREFEQITFARILLSQYQTDHSNPLLHEVMGFLERLLKSAEQGERMGTVIEILVLQALAYQLQNNLPAALKSLERALILAEPEGYLRVFVDEGADMATLLRKAVTKGVTPDYAGKLLLALEAEGPGLNIEAARPASTASSSMIEPLSQRELDILRLFKTELSGPEIAQELVIALSTVRTHTKSIYSKLNVNSRRAAVKRAMELGLI